jgi:hypothetical protein
MANLILTESEKRCGSYMEWDDASLGRLVKYAATIINDESGDRATRLTAAALTMIDAAAEVGSERTDFEITGVSSPEPMGDWVVSVHRKEART